MFLLADQSRRGLTTIGVIVRCPKHNPQRRTAGPKQDERSSLWQGGADPQHHDGADSS